MATKKTAPRRWLHGWHPAPGEAPVFWTGKQIERLVKKHFARRWVVERGYHRGPILGDAEYYLPSLAEAQTIITRSRIARDQYAPSRFDCDDFAYMLKAAFCEAAYERQRRKFGYCFGIIWGEKLWTGKQDESHAMNWMITRDGVFRLVEPQTGIARELKPASVGDKGVYLLMV
jgi:agglutinin domain-containing protein